MIDYIPYIIIIRHYKGCWAGMRPLVAEVVIMAAQPQRPTLAICQNKLAVQAAVATQAGQAAASVALEAIHLVACPTKVI